MKRVLTGDPQLQAVQDAARDASTQQQWEAQIPLGKVTSIHRSASTAYLGTLHRVVNGAAVTLQAVSSRQHQSRMVVVLNTDGALSTNVRAAKGGEINGSTAAVAIAAGGWGLFVVAPDADNEWSGLL